MDTKNKVITMSDLELARILGVTESRPETAAQTYRLCLVRLGAETGSPADQAEARRRWSTLGDLMPAMDAAFKALTPEERAADLAQAESDLEWAEMWA